MFLPLWYMVLFFFSGYFTSTKCPQENLRCRLRIMINATIPLWRKIAIIVCLGLFISLGYWKSLHLASFTMHNDTSLYPYNPKDNPLSVNGMVQGLSSSDRLYWNLVFSLLYMILTVVNIHVMFWKKRYSLLTLSIFLIFFVLCLLFIGIDMLTGTYNQGYEVARMVKDHLIQKPLVLIMMILGIKILPLLRLSDKS